MQISRRKRKLSKRSRRHTQKCAARRELTSWFTCVTLSVLHCLFVVLLTKCMDVEKNPGPDENFVSLMQNVDWRKTRKQEDRKDYADSNKSYRRLTRIKKERVQKK